MESRFLRAIGECFRQVTRSFARPGRDVEQLFSRTNVTQLCKLPRPLQAPRVKGRGMHLLAPLCSLPIQL